MITYRKSDIPEHLQRYFQPAELGLEPTPEAYVANMVAVFREVWRVLRDDGTLWLNLGSSYAGSGKGGNPEDSPHQKQRTNAGSLTVLGRPAFIAATGYKQKDLIPIPWLVAMALQADGWYLRQDIIWSKPNPMPESVTDRCTKAHEYIFLLSKSATYWSDFEAIKEPVKVGYNGSRFDDERDLILRPNTQRGPRKHDGTGSGSDGSKIRDHSGESLNRPDGLRNKRSVWTVTTQPFSGAHFAVFPEKLITPCVLAGCPDKCCPKCGMGWERMVERISIGKRYSTGKSKKKNDVGLVTGFSGYNDGSSAPVFRTLGFRPACDCGETASVPGTVLDPFGGAGTTAVVAGLNRRNAILCELNPAYMEIAKNRIKVELQQQLLKL